MYYLLFITTIGQALESLFLHMAMNISLLFEE
jgi:hypothetical protein